MSGKITMPSKVVYGRSTAAPHVRKIKRVDL